MISDKTKQYVEMLKSGFDLEKFKEFISDLLNLESEDKLHYTTPKAPTTEQYRTYIQNSQLYAKYTDKNRAQIGVLIIQLQENKNPANARTLQRNYIAHLMEHHELDASLTAIYTNNDNNWRFSFVKQETEIEVGTGRIKEKLSPAKRYSYLFGKDEPNHTAQEQLLELLENNEKKYTISEIEEKFSVEKVTKDFFEKYKEYYLRIQESLDKNPEFISEAKRCDFTSEEFTKKLMGQLVFLYFLQKKGWLGVHLVPPRLNLEEYNQIYNNSDITQKKVLADYYITQNGAKILKTAKTEKIKENEQELDILSSIFVGTQYDRPWGTGQKTFVRKLYDKAINMNKDFFDDYLEPFFYNGLNYERKNQYFGLFNCKIPFLNGGLFEPLDNYNWKVAKFEIKNEYFSNASGDGILDFFDRYNFTISEEEPLEKEVAVDPEMLGKIFENLLDVKDRKSKGAFYTPREIVHYMCQESLANYLVNKVNVNYNEIKELIQYGEMMKDIDLKEATPTEHILGNSVFDKILQIDKALENIKIADPAVGSGAFPLGMLNEIVKLRDILTSYILILNKFSIGIFTTKYSEEKIINKRSIYNLKWNTIKNCIYAVDIENSAVDITKLRLWLSIVVDQHEVPLSGPEPLPNLECKIMQGNSLIDEYAGTKLLNPDLIKIYKNKNFKINQQLKLFGNNDSQVELFEDEKISLIDNLIKAKSDLFETNNPKEKRKLIEMINSYRKDLIKINYRGSNKIEELMQQDNSHNKPYFSWELEFIEVFVKNDGFDIVIGNPPYGLINKKQNQQKTIEMTTEQINYIKNNIQYESAKGGLLNIYRLFVCKSHYILKDNGNMCLIFPMAFMCDLSASKLRKFIFANSTIKFIEAFPERDNENTRVFRAAKMSVCILDCQRDDTASTKNDFFVRTHWDKFVDEKNEKVLMNLDIIKEIDEINLTIPLINSIELNIMRKIINGSKKIENYSKCFEGEVNLTFHKEFISNSNIGNDILIRGAQVQRYMISDTVSQGEILFLNKSNYLEKVTSEKSKHHQHRRIVMQGITGINEKRRLKMTLIENNEFCANSANYLLENSNYEIEYILGILNSKMMNWFFKKLSTNSNVNGYEIDNLPLKEKYLEELITKVKDYMNLKLQENIKTDFEVAEKAIDELVYRIYELDEKSIEYIEGEIQ